MIINIKNKKDLITIDLNLKQIRYLKDFKQQGEIEFINLSNNEAETYEYLFKKNKRLLLKSLKDDLFLFLDKRILIKDLKIIEQEK